MRYVQTVAAAALLAACAGQSAPVPVIGAAADVRRLAGQWLGEYSSNETGRAGSIAFTLDSAEDHAHGDVMMSPPNRVWTGFDDERYARGPEPPDLATARVLAIEFVRARGDQVSGVLAPYDDPACQCPVRTEFVGRLVADTLDGTYETRQVAGGTTTSGRWRVLRRH